MQDILVEIDGLNAFERNVQTSLLKNAFFYDQFSIFRVIVKTKIGDYRRKQLKSGNAQNDRQPEGILALPSPSHKINQDQWKQSAKGSSQKFEYIKDQRYA